MYFGYDFILIWYVFGIVPVFIEHFSQFLSSVVDIKITICFTSCYINNVCCSEVLPSDFLNFLPAIYVFKGPVAIS